MVQGMATEGTHEELPAYCTAGVLVLGCGNPLMGDDGFGPAVAELMISSQAAGRKAERQKGTTTLPSLLPAARCLLPPFLCVINAGTGSRGIIFNLVTGPARPNGMIIVDALGAGKRPGELFWVDIDDLSIEKAEDFSLHMTPASNMLLELRRMGMDIRILACQPLNLPDMMQEGLSKNVQAAVGPAAEIVMGTAREMSGHQAEK